MIVAKFGGSSVKGPNEMALCLDVLLGNSEIQVVVLSATYNTTNYLEEIWKSKSLTLLTELFERHKKISEDLEIINHDLNFEFDKLWGLYSQYLENYEQNLQSLDFFYGLGEQLSTLIFFHYAKKKMPERSIKRICAYDWMATDNSFTKANPIFEEIEKKSSLFKIEKESLYITEGFLGKGKNNFPTTLGREGSDYTATILGSLLNASKVIIWTDVAGIASADPRFVSNSTYIKNLSYLQAETMARYGSKVLFFRTMEPAWDKKIPVWVKSTKENQERGTCISEIREKTFSILSVSLEGPYLCYVGHFSEVQLKKLVESKLFQDHFINFSIMEYSSEYFVLKGKENLEKDKVYQKYHDLIINLNNFFHTESHKSDSLDCNQ